MRTPIPQSPWDLAGMLTGNGTLGGPMPVQEWPAPAKIWLEGDRLVWELDAGKETRPDPRMLTQFVGLASSGDESILKFARRWGVLMLCEHGLPTTHNPQCYPRGWHDRQAGVLWVLWEPLEDWRFWSRQAKALLSIVANLHRDKVGDPSDWQTIYERAGLRGMAIPWWNQALDVERMKIASVVSEWLELGNARLSLHWHAERSPSVEVRGSLFSALGVQLMQAIARSEGLALCSACGRVYGPSRKPRSGERTYCEDCRNAGAAGRDAARDYYRRRREKQPGGDR